MPQQRDLQALFDLPKLRPVLPMIYVAWADGELTDDEVRSVREQAKPVLDDESREQLDVWLDPQNPPTATDLMRLLRKLREAATNIDATRRQDLADLGAALATEPIGDEVKLALEEIQTALGWLGPEAAAEIVPKLAPEPPVPTEPASFDVDRMQTLLDGKYAAQKQKVRKLLVGTGWDYLYDQPKEALRANVTQRLRALAEMGLGEVAYPGVTSEGDLGHFVSTFETLGYFDLSLVVKYGVQFGLWGGSVYFLGTEKHHQKYLPDVAAMRLPGCFAMSELGHGSNVRDVQTTITYDPGTDELVVHTPSESARKDWIGNAARDGRMATVFAQLIVRDEHYGVHAVVVPLRDEQGNVLPGVTIEDCGLKLGLNGVDNGRIWFDHVRVPRENLLDRYASIDENGQYQSPITSAGKRFFTMIGTLVGGRVAVGASALSATKSALTIATRYATERRQFGPSEGPEVPILDYRTHQLRLIPRIAKAYALSFAFQDLVDQFVAGIGDDDKRELEATAAGLKCYATWFANDTVQECREACGGQGYLASNRFASIRADVDIFATFEGDNTVLMQLVAKSRLTEFKNEFGEPTLFSVARFLAKQAGTFVAEKNPYATRHSESEHLRSAEFQLGVLTLRDNDVVTTLANRFRSRLQKDVPPFEALNQCQDHFLAVAHAHVERLVYESFTGAIARTSDPKLADLLNQLRALYGLCCIQEEMGWFMENGYIETAKARAIRTEINALCEELRPQARHLVDAFGIPDELLAAPIGLGRISG